MRFSVPFYFDGCKLSVFGQKRPQKARNFCINCLKHLTKIFGNGRITLATVWAQVFSRAKNLQFEKICGYHTAKTSRKKSPREQKSHFLRAPPICRKCSAFGKRVNLRLFNLRELLKQAAKREKTPTGAGSAVRRCLPAIGRNIFVSTKRFRREQTFSPREQKSHFLRAPPICAWSVSGGKGECDDFYKGEPFKTSSQRKNRTQSRRKARGERWVFPENHGIFANSFRKNS